MKTRIDFVSNSSSCSFIIAVNSNYSIEALAKDIAKATVAKKDEWHDPKLEGENRSTLLFCMSTYHLAWFGGVILGRYVQTQNRQNYIELFGDDECWNEDVEAIEEVKSNPKKFSKYQREFYKNSTYDKKNEEIVNDEDICVYAPIMSDKEMNHSWYDTDKQKAIRLIKIAKDIWKKQHNISTIEIQPEIYQISKQTLDNTRLLMKLGYKFDFTDTGTDKSIDDLEKMIGNGDKLFYIRQAHSGDGRGDYYIYCEEGAHGLSDISGIEVIGGEAM